MGRDDIGRHMAPVWRRPERNRPRSRAGIDEAVDGVHGVHEQGRQQERGGPDRQTLEEHGGQGERGGAQAEYRSVRTLQAQTR